MNTPRQYAVLRIVAIVIQVLAWIFLVGGVILTLVWLINAQNMFAGIWFEGINWIGLIFLIIGVSNFIPLYFTSSVLLMMCDLEHNTRANSAALEQLTKLAQAAETARLSASAPKPAAPATTTPASTAATTAASSPASTTTPSTPATTSSSTPSTPSTPSGS